MAEKVAKAREHRDRQLGLLALEIRDLQEQLTGEAVRRRREIWAAYDDAVRSA